MTLNERPDTSTFESILAIPGANNNLASDVLSEAEPLDADESVLTDVGPVFKDKLIIEHFAFTTLPSCSLPYTSNPIVGVTMQLILGLILII